eukprot:1564699-Alexandrium_andersonii.AAC.1
MDPAFEALQGVKNGLKTLLWCLAPPAVRQRLLDLLPMQSGEEHPVAHLGNAEVRGGAPEDACAVLDASKAGQDLLRIGAFGNIKVKSVENTADLRSNGIFLQHRN